MCLVDEDVDIDKTLKIISGSADTTIKTWQLTLFDIIKKKVDIHFKCDYKRAFIGHNGSIKNLMVINGTEPLTKLIVSSSYDSTIRIWNENTGECNFILKSKDYTTKFNEYSNMSISTFPTIKIVNSHNNNIYIWNPFNGKCNDVFSDEGDKGLITALLVINSKNKESRIITGSSNGIIRVINILTGLCELYLRGHKLKITSIVRMPDGRIASASMDNTIRIWDLDIKNWNENTRDQILYNYDENNEEYEYISDASDHISRLEISPDNKLVSISSNNCIKIWY